MHLKLSRFCLDNGEGLKVLLFQKSSEKMKVALYVSLLIALLPSRVRIAIYKLTGAKIGKGVKIGFGTVIISNEIEIDDNSTIGHFCRIKVSEISLGKCVAIGNLSKITVHAIRMDSRAQISSSVSIVGDSRDKRSVIKMGMHSWIFEKCYINVVREVTLGRNVGIGGGSFLFTHGSWLSKLDGYPVNYASVSIDDNVWIPWNCFIMPGIKIGKNTIIGASSLVNKDVPENVLAAGHPIRVIRENSCREVSLEEKTNIIKDSIQDYAEYNNKKFERNEADQRIEFSLDQKIVIILHRNMPNDISGFSKTALNVLFVSLSKDIIESYPCFSLKDYLSSSVDVMPKLAVEWLQFATCIGLRFYPIDEVS